MLRSYCLSSVLKFLAITIISVQILSKIIRFRLSLCDSAWTILDPLMCMHNQNKGKLVIGF